MTDTDATALGEASWGDALPAEIKSLEFCLTTAFHAFDDIDRMTMEHRVRVVNDVTGTVPDTASAAARAGHAEWAVSVVRAASERRPAWSSLCSRWDAMIASSLDAISASALVT
ncbi:hypothetical protein GCM10025867_23150 [Frondihabitans sucicola]|uniref:DUF222 domain-containing protein n=1 Tax=Frondihabitans sucicola TaxID=1268041 RepID=A0ABN6XYL2_9MICO|nr:hypothetical protein [Frondihabitans sucicola]BDZ50074.1 hypothetical protein GCM10025867_23150 [Frondihabitans sucicola]